MAKRPIRMKQAARMRKVLRRKPLPAFIDLVSYLKLHGYADTTGQAEAIILARRVRSESHTLGVTKGLKPKADAKLKLVLGKTLENSDYEEVDVVQRCIPAAHRPTLTVLPA